MARLDETISTGQSDHISDHQRLAQKANYVYDVTDFGATGDGVTDDTASVNLAIQAAGVDSTILVPPGVYMVDAEDSTGESSQPVGVDMDTARQTLRLMKGATLRAIANSGTNYSVIQVSAADVTIEGFGTVEGDVGRHTGGTGEWGHCIDINVGADRCTVRGVTCTLAWGDGIFVMGRPEDVSLIDVRCIDNRRQGCTIIDAIRPRILGGLFADTGVTAYKAPSAGINIEPDSGTSRDVIDCLISNTVTSNNHGPGIMVASNGRTVSGTVVGCLSTGDATELNDPWQGAFYLDGATNELEFVNCTAQSSTGAGFKLDDGLDVGFRSCSAYDSAWYGFILTGTRVTLTACTAVGNVYSGFTLLGADPYLSGCVAHSNTGVTIDLQYDIHATDALLTSCVSDAGTTTPNYAFAVRTGATGARLLGCSARGSFGSGAWLDQVGDAVAWPIPGVNATPDVTGARDDGTALADLLTDLESLGLITDSTTAS